MPVDVVFLGVNNAGERIYDWLCDREDATVHCMVTEKSQLRLIEQLKPDLIISVGFGYLVPEAVLSIPPRGCVNVHPALLPYNRGMAPNVWSIVDETPAGVSIHYMDESFDTGPIIEQRAVDTDFDDTGKSLHERLEDEQLSLFKQTWPDIKGGNPDVNEQANRDGTYHTTDDFVELCELHPDSTTTVIELLNRLRALTFPPFDNAYIEVDGERYFVEVQITPEEEASGEEPEGHLSSY